MATIYSGDFIALEGYSAHGAGTIGCPVYYVEGAKREVMVLTNFHVFAAPVGLPAFQKPKELHGKAVKWAPRSGGATGTFSRIGTIFAYDIPYTSQNRPPGGDDRVDVAIVKLDPGVRFGRRAQSTVDVDALTTFDSFYGIAPIEILDLAAPEILFGDLQPYDWISDPAIMGSFETLNLIDETFKKAHIPEMPLNTGDPSRAMGRLVVKLSGASGYSIGYVHQVGHQYRATGIPSLEMVFNSLNTVKTVRGEGQLEMDSGSAVFDLLTEELYGLVSFHGAAFGTREPHRWVFTSILDIKNRFNNGNVLFSFGHKGYLRFA